MSNLWWKSRQMKHGKTCAMVQTWFTAGKEEVELDRVWGLNTCIYTHSVWLAHTEKVSKLRDRDRKTGSQAVCTRTTPLGLQLSLHGYGGLESQKRLRYFPPILGDSFIPVCLHSLCLSVQNSYSCYVNKSRAMEKIPSVAFHWVLRDLKVYFI